MYIGENESRRVEGGGRLKVIIITRAENNTVYTMYEAGVEVTKEGKAEMKGS